MKYFDFLKPKKGALNWLIVGLGNPGKKYAGTRHNAGAMVLAELVRRHPDAFGQLVESGKFKAKIAKGRLGDHKVLLAFPQTFMNLSGLSVSAIAKFYRLPAERVLVIFDDKDLPLGTLRLRPEGGAGGHNGVKSIIGDLGTDKFPRLRVGIGTAVTERADTADFVLGHPSAEEKAKLAKAVEQAANAIETAMKEGLDAAMNRFN